MRTLLNILGVRLQPAIWVYDHEFVEDATGTVMQNRFEFESPLGILGRVADWLFLTSYIRRFLVRQCSAETVGGIDGREPLPWAHLPRITAVGDN